MATTGYTTLDASGNYVDLNTILDSANVTGNVVVTNYKSGVSNTDLGSIFTLYANLAGLGKTGLQSGLIGYSYNGSDIGTLFVKAGTVSGGGGPTGLLTSLPTGAVGIYACKWVNNGYTGPILKLRANTDTGGTGMTDFYMNSAGTAIGTSSNGTGTTLSAWLASQSSATIAYVHTWYDQSGVANNMTQTTTGNQPYLVLTSGLYNVFFSNTYTAYFENATNIIGTGKVSHTISYRVADTSTLLQVTNIACVGAVGTKTDITAGLFNNFTGGVYGMYYDFGADYIQTNYGSALPNNTTYSYSYDGTNKNAYFNKSVAPTVTQTNTTLNVATGTPTRIGYCFNDVGRRFQGSLSNISIFNTALSNANRAIIENIYPETGLLASLPTGAVGIYACKWVNNGYTGPILKIRANTDTGGTGMTDFYMNSAGTAIGTALGGTGTSLTAWLVSQSSATIAYVHTWYDQSGLANNATQTVIANQPFLSTTALDATKYYVDLSTTGAVLKYFNLVNGTIPYLNNPSYTISFKHYTTNTSTGNMFSYNGGTNYPIFIGAGINSPSALIIRGEPSTNYRMIWGGYLSWAFNVPMTTADINISTFKFVNATSTTGTQYYYGNRAGTNYTATNATTSAINWGNTFNMIGYCNNGAFPVNSPMYQMCIFNTALSDPDRAIMEGI